jgi:hypothetical protein
MPDETDERRLFVATLVLNGMIACDSLVLSDMIAADLGADRQPVDKARWARIAVAWADALIAAAAGPPLPVGVPRGTSQK